MPPPSSRQDNLKRPFLFRERRGRFFLLEKIKMAKLNKAYEETRNRASARTYERFQILEEKRPGLCGYSPAKVFKTSMIIRRQKH